MLIKCHEGGNLLPILNLGIELPPLLQAPTNLEVLTDFLKRGLIYTCDKKYCGGAEP